MVQIEAADADLTTLLERVEHGEPVRILRNGRAVAEVFPPKQKSQHTSQTLIDAILGERNRRTSVQDRGATTEEPGEKMSVQEAIDGIRELRKGCRLDGISIRELIDEGRR